MMLSNDANCRRAHEIGYLFSRHGVAAGELSRELSLSFER